MPVTLVGEPAVGKTTVARIAHRLSSRSEGPFVVWSALHPDLKHTREGGEGNQRPFLRYWQTHLGPGIHSAFYAADGGTVVVEHLEKLAQQDQGALLRQIEEPRRQDFGLQPLPPCADVRIIVTSNEERTVFYRLLQTKPGLYECLHHWTVRVPPLRERREDIVPLAEHFLRRRAAAIGVRTPAFAKQAQLLLERYRWPGNLLELCHAMAEIPLEAIDSGEIGAKTIEAALPRSRSARGRSDAKRFSKAEILTALKHEGGCVSAVARTFSVSRRHLYRVMRAQRIDPDELRHQS